MGGHAGIIKHAYMTYTVQTSCQAQAGQQEAFPVGWVSGLTPLVPSNGGDHPSNSKLSLFLTFLCLKTELLSYCVDKKIHGVLPEGLTILKVTKSTDVLMDDASQYISKFCLRNFPKR